ncbi:two component transcriptional regulator, AraC family [Virgibacillus subterraneus]|uniref:Two component transcriptional regulator, AraC family n=1 Tax=Virgibacillus subterraneus TaxID=621109 RepID=A0A1H9AZ39_9BACI|nr:response regulator [Virgibacillus subterraneus]SEP81785.1 two component transcriptional regulator, AraC family [Virgibacillus subterraneus]
MRVLIAEDELLERKAMKKFIESNFTDMRIVGEAQNGRKAIELAESTHPDIIFMDIKMPGINGLEAIKEITKHDPSIKFILVSAYDSFGYAKQAMNYGIKEYILKPGKKEEIVRAILRVKKEILHEREQQDEKRKLFKERLFTKLMHQPVSEEAYDIQQMYFPEMQTGYFLVAKLNRLVDEDTVELILKKHIRHSFIFNMTEERLSICVLVTMNIDKAEVLTVARRIQLEIGENCFIGAGYPCESLENFPRSYQEALTASYQLNKVKKRNYGFLREKENDRKEIITRLLAEIGKGNDRYSVDIFNEEDFTTSDLEEIYFNIRQLLEERGISIPDSSISELNSPYDWHTFITICCMNLQEYYQSKQYIAKAKTFVEENYCNGVTLEETSAYVDLSPNYFSNVFKQEFGQTFIDYVTKLRMEKAKGLIQENVYSLKEISYMVGYNDPNYFSRVFKKYYQMSPKHFQYEIFKK